LHSRSAACASLRVLLFIVSRDKVDAIDRTRVNTEVAAIAFGFDNTVHAFGRAKDCICRTRLYAFSATYAFVFSNTSHRRRERWHVRWVECGRKIVYRLRESARGNLAAGWTEISCRAAQNSFGIGPTAEMATLTALRLG